MVKTITFTNALIYRNQNFETTNLTITDTKIVAIGPQLIGEIISLPNGSLITPGFIDLHAHFREPGQTNKEDLLSGAMAALYGGYQTVCLMPNTTPTTDNLNILQPLMEKARTAPINLKFFGAITKNLAGEEETDWESLNNMVVGFSDDGSYLANHQMLEAILRFGANNEKLVSLHVDSRHKLVSETKILRQEVAKKFGLQGVDDDYESNPLSRDLGLALKHQLPYHLCHLSTQKSVDLLKKSRLINSKITAEVTPHHLVLSLEDIHKDDANFMMNPPLNRAIDRQSLIQALNEGIIDVIATDHAPHEAISKAGFATGTMGIIGLEFAFPLLYTHLVKTKQVPLEIILEAMSIKPAKLINHSDISLNIGNEATFTILDLAESQPVLAEKLHSKSHNTPFLNQELFGWPWANVQHGKIYYLKGETENVRENSRKNYIN
ncbi:dihydroorotase [Entomoplasma freundtii]|uniref:Dihydroorotase n=1 Tax=Entomoplasma freundtii TaxID=74700 RepID=A0A2K8NRH6_9MOLU|nr:dihydroorotase [Entomoplasma freundtii]ATZ16126.1 dihydroorotase [Entomoplasma freundtii]TDY56973.1 dihydroorotase [Entomoplasma freundtii]